MLVQIVATFLLVLPHLAASTRNTSTVDIVEEVKDVFNGHFSDPSAKAGQLCVHSTNYIVDVYSAM